MTSRVAIQIGEKMEAVPYHLCISMSINKSKEGKERGRAMGWFYLVKAWGHCWDFS